MIEKFSPSWNRRIGGFGNHDPGKGRHKQQRSAWDALHPGRSWAENLEPYSTGDITIRESTSKYIAESEIRLFKPPGK